MYLMKIPTNTLVSTFDAVIAISETNEFFYYICQYNFITSDEIIYDEYNTTVLCFCIILWIHIDRIMDSNIRNTRLC